MKVMCTKCGKVFDTEQDENGYAFCNECGNNFLAQQGRKLLVKQYSAYSNYAYRCLTTTGEYDKAIEYYEKCMSLKDKDFSSIIGIALAKLYSHTLLETHFNQIIPVFEKYEISLTPENTLLLLSFTEDVLAEANRYFEDVDDRLVKEGKFIANKYLLVYESSLNDLEDLFKYLKEAILMGDEEEINQFEEDNPIRNKIDEILKTIKERKSQKFKVQENEEILEENDVSVINEEAIKQKKIFMIIEGVSLVLLILVLILANTLKNNWIYLFLLVPVALGLGGFLLYKFWLKNNQNL